MKIGYARVSSVGQNLDRQLDALGAAGCERIYEDKKSGASADRVGLEEALKMIRKGDEFCVLSLDRAGRSLSHLIKIINQVEERGAAFVSLKENIDTTSASGRLLFNIMGSLAEFERTLILERSKAGIEAARARGKLIGRPKKLSKDKQELAVKLFKEKEHSAAAIARLVGVSKPTLYKYLRVEGALK